MVLGSRPDALRRESVADGEVRWAVVEFGRYEGLNARLLTLWRLALRTAIPQP